MRRVHGWLGIQRYADRSDFGIDIIRNGRKIEVGNKDLFKWHDEDVEVEEVEYPIDDPRDRGRIVGEIHLDHCRVPYTKDRFVREDAAWREMVTIVRGTTPLQPVIAERMGAGGNTSQLYRLFQAFRRNSPHSKRAGGWNRILAVPGNDRALAMAKRFYAGESEYQTDEKWWELVEEAEVAVLHGGSSGAVGTETLGGDATNGDSGEVLGGDDETATATGEAETTEEPEETAIRTRLPSLSQQYSDDLTNQRFEVEAFSVGAADPVLEALDCPWAILRTTAGPWKFYVDLDSPAFRSMTFTPIDALLSQLAWLVSDFERGQASRWTFGAILVSLREKHAVTSKLDPTDLIAEASAQLVDIARSIVGRIGRDDARAFFDDLSPSRQEQIRVTMASRGVSNPHGAVDDCRCLQYASPSVIAEFVPAHSELFFDGAYWDDPYEGIDYGSTTATGEARARLLGHYGGLLADVVWLAQQTPEELEVIGRERLMMASLATALLSPMVSIGE